MNTYRYIVEIECDTPEQAEIVLGARLGCDDDPYEYENEDGNSVEFDYLILTWVIEER